MKSWLNKFGHILLLLFLQSSLAQVGAQIYFFEGDDVVFEFDRRIYAKADAEGSSDQLDFSDLKIYEVIVSGNFNNWSEDGWQMKKIGRHKFQLRKPIEHFDDPFTWEYKFLVNGQYWIEPLPGTTNQKILSNDFWKETFNLTFNKVEPDENGNTLFLLSGYEWVEEMILAGSFNNWNEHDLKMGKVQGGWEVRIDLPPGRYEYKFIADGNWLHDPDNPHKVKNEHNTYNSVLQVNKAVTFQLAGFPGAEKVILAGSFNKWNEHDLTMTRQGDFWTITLNLTGGKHLYKFIVDGEWMTDPANHLKEADRHGNFNSVLMVR
jgi:hypothetical protein